MSPEAPPLSTEQRTLQALEEIARWTKFMGLAAARDTLKETLRSDEDRAIYHMSTGLSSREIEKALHVSRSTVQDRWAKWQAIGIVRDSTRWQGRKEAVFTLLELGLQVPEAIAKLKSGPPAASTDHELDSSPLRESPAELEKYDSPEHGSKDREPATDS